MAVDNKKVLHFSRVAWEKMWGMTLRAKGEVSGFGLIDEHDPCRVVDFFVVKQTVTSSNTLMDPSALDDLFMNSRDKGIALDRWRVWWHSHANMQAFFSGTDESTVQRYASEKPLWSVVTNHADARRVAAGHSPTEMYIRVDGFDPDNPKSRTSPSRYTIEGCGWSVGNIQVVPDSWFDEHMKLVEDQVPRMIQPAVQGRSRATSQRYGGSHRTVSVPYSTTPRPRTLADQGHFEGWGDEDDPYASWGREGGQLIRPYPAEEPEQLPAVEPQRVRTRQLGSPVSQLAAIDNDIPLSHPFIEGMYLYGLLRGNDALEISGEYANNLVDEPELVRHLNEELDRQTVSRPELQSPDVRGRIRNGRGPIEPEVVNA